MRYFAVLGAISAVWLAPSVAEACGGVSCSVPQLNAAPEPVDQSAEQIIFDVGDGTITAHVLISYTGSADEFAWIVPVAGTPVIGESENALFRSLGELSGMAVVLPSPPNCGSSGGGRPVRSFGCGADDEASALADGGSGGQAMDDPDVTIYAEGRTDTYDYSVIGTTEGAGNLVQWLQQNGYTISDNMIPAMQTYVASGSNFAAFRLRDGRDATDVAPITIQYAGTMPSIPLELTAIAARPLMGIQVFILGDGPFLPANFGVTAPDEQAITFRSNLGTGGTETNYYEWVGRVADESFGRMWVAEHFSDQYETLAQQYGLSGTYLSRFYTRMSPHHMSLDPVFAAASVSDLPIDEGQFQLDLSDQPFPTDCSGGFQAPSPCAFNYCGLDATCFEQNGLAGCQCPEGQVATGLIGPDGGRRVTCVPRENPVGITAAAGGAGTEFDPCLGAECGQGTCVLRNGFATCMCDEGALFVSNFGEPICVPREATAQDFGPGAGEEAVLKARKLNMPEKSASFPVGGLLLISAFSAAWRKLRKANSVS